MSVHRYSIGDRVTEEELAIDYFKHFAVGDLVVSPIAEIYNCDQRVCPPCVYRLRALAAGEIVGLGTYDRAGDIRAGRQYALVRYDRGNWECMAAPDSDAYKARNGAEVDAQERNGWSRRGSSADVACGSESVGAGLEAGG